MKSPLLIYVDRSSGREKNLNASESREAIERIAEYLNVSSKAVLLSLKLNGQIETGFSVYKVASEQ